MEMLRAARQAAGFTQAELAARAGVSRQLVGAAEAGRNVPRVDAALAIAAVLDCDVDTLFGSAPEAVDVLAGTAPADGSLVRAGRVGSQVVTAPARLGVDGWGVADAVVERGVVGWLGRQRPGFVVAGCEPGLEVLERLLREGGMGAVAASGSSALAIRALTARRVHAAVVHGPALDTQPGTLPPIERFHLTRWRVGLAAPIDATDNWWATALAGRVPVIQRESGAGVQRTFEQAADPKALPIDGPIASGHLDAAYRAVASGMAAVTIEPAAVAVGAAFRALDVHDAELWVDGEWATDRPVAEALDTIASARFQRRLTGVGGYDLSGCGSRVG